MIEVMCGCASPRKLPEAAVGKKFKCPNCSKQVHLVCGEQLAEGAGAGDFDAGLEVTSGPDLAGARMLLGGVAELQVGKLPDRQIILGGNNVSRAHCKLQRVDFGPSRWKVVDNKSTNGLYVNGSRVSEHELQDGDLLTIGDFDLTYSHFSPSIAETKPDEDELDIAPDALPAKAATRPGLRAAAAGGADLPMACGPRSAAALRAEAEDTTGGQTCPSCEKALSKRAKICVSCGINIKTGRPVLTSQGVDENSLYEGAYQWIRIVSWFVWVTPMPIPIRSEAFGTRKPYAIWTIALLTTIASIAFFIAQHSGDGIGFDRPGKELMLWSPRVEAGEFPGVTQQKIHSIARKLTEEDRQELREQADDPHGKLSDDELVAKAMESVLSQFTASRGEFHVYQLLTHSFLHDTSSLRNFAMHLAGNMLFMLVFGTRVNALIGSLATAILYPILAVCAALAHLYLGAASSGPMLGASGAIMGLAGMYLILFPAHRVFCAMWIRLWWWFSFRMYFGCKIFQMRGFWILLIYFGYDLLMNAISSHFGSTGGVAHLAHIGGFTTGMILALAVLFSRLFNTHGGDALSVTLGKYAWPLIGKPSRWIQAAPAELPRAVSLSYQ